MKTFTRLMLPGLLMVCLIVGVKSVSAAAGTLDPTFSQGGVTVTSKVGLQNVGSPYMNTNPCVIFTGTKLR